MTCPCQNSETNMVIVVQHCDFHFSSTAVEDVFFSLRGELFEVTWLPQFIVLMEQSFTSIYRLDQPDSSSLSRGGGRRTGSEIGQRMRQFIDEYVQTCTL
jgi:hypothetical protein